MARRLNTEHADRVTMACGACHAGAMGDVAAVSLEGVLVCADDAEAARVRELLPEHIALTRAEPGCLAFDVLPASPFEWTVNERFRDRDALAAHQERAAASAWGRGTAGIQRRYTVTG